MTTALEVLKEFVRDVEAAYPLRETYLRAKEVLDREARMDPGHADPFKVKKWIRRDDRFPSDTENMSDIIGAAARALEKSCSWDIVGECVFLGEDDQYYVGTVEFVVGIANPDYIKELLEENDAEGV